MDPNSCLTHMRAMANDILLTLDAEKVPTTDDVEELAEMIQNLDEWIRRGGFLPDDWNYT